jgi:general transcription factor 3C polypeptide 6
MAKRTAHVNRDRVATEDDSDGWETEEEQLVQVELSGFFQDDLSKNPKLHTKFVGLDTEQPVIQLGNQVFAGKYTETIGTTVYFKASRTDSDDVDKADPVFDNKPTEPVEYFCKTDRKLLLKRVFLGSKDTASNAT